MLKIKSAKKNEKGIALIFTLIMLSLLMILALSFALDSMFEQKAAYNSASSSSSGFMAQAQLKQVLLLLKEGQANFDSDGYLYSHDSGSATDTDMLISRLPVAGVLKGDPDNPTDSNKNDKVFDLNNNGTYDDPKVNWNYIKAADGSIIGRTAFVVVPEDKIPLDSLLDDRAVSATLSASCLYPKHNEKDDTETRIGKYVSEINVRATISPLPDSSGSISEITETLNWSGNSTDSNRGFTDGKYNGSWLSFNSLFSTINTAISPDLSDDDKTEFEDKLTLTVANDAEAFWAEASGGDTTIDSSELYKRFDLTRTDWSTPTTSAEDVTFIENKLLLDSDSDGEPDQGMETWSDTDSDSDTNSKGLPWLACFGYKTDGNVDTTLAGTFGSGVAAVSARRFQIAANLKDYCDSGDSNRPTSDVDPGTWFTLPSLSGYVHPTYTGNERTPYINKVGVKISTRQNDSASSPYNVWADVVISPSVELINIYDTSYSDSLTVRIEGTITIRIQVAGVSTTTSKTQDFNCSININSWEWPNPGYSKFAMDSSILPFKTNSQSVIGGTRKVDFEVTQINFTKVVLINGTDGYDYTKNLVANYTSPLLIELNNAAGYKHLWYGFAVHDPRQNLNGTTIPDAGTAADADWLILTPLETSNPADVLSIDGSGNGVSNAVNSTNGLGGDDTDNPTDGVDPETTIDSATGISTAYIRNGSMESPWELGFIHRGARWQTINLKKYDTSKAFQLATAQINGKDYIPGGGAYASGDANILDQIKMTANAESPQKINLSSKVDETFDVLFSKVKLGCDIDSALTVKSIAGIDTTTTGKEIDTTTAPTTVFTTMRTAIKSKFASPDTTTFTNLTRASIADSTTNILISANETEPDPTIGLNTATTDAAQEELIGKIVNLTKVGEQSGDFTIIVLAQTINDIGGPGTTSITVYKVPADGSDALPVDCEIGNFDVTPASPATATWTDDAYGDEITGEQKIMVKINNTSNIITIKSFQYID